MVGVRTERPSTRRRDVTVKHERLKVGDSHELRRRRRPHPHADRDVRRRVGRLQPAAQRRGVHHAGRRATRRSSPTACSAWARPAACSPTGSAPAASRSYGVRFVNQVWPGDTLDRHRDRRSDPRGGRRARSPTSPSRPSTRTASPSSPAPRPPDSIPDPGFRTRRCPRPGDTSRLTRTAPAGRDSSSAMATS